MSDFPKNFPFGKNIWIWVLDDCLAGNVSAIIQKCKDNGIDSLIIKGADGIYGWSQFTQELVDQIHAAGLKIYSWQYAYGADPVREADLAISLLDHGVDGHVIDAESEYEHLTNPAAAATLMMTTIRQKHPDAFIAYASFPIVDSHTNFPYVQFNQYCNAVMPQVYWNEWQKSPTDAINWMYQQWSKWQNAWKAAGLPGSTLPIIPLGSFYDTPSYTLSPADIASFIKGVAGYLSVSMWSFQHIIRNDCWQAIHDNKVNPNPQNTQTPENGQNQTQAVSSTNTQTTPSNTTTPAMLSGPTTFGQEQLPADIFNSTDGDIKTFNGQQVVVHVNDNGTRTLTPYIPPLPPLTGPATFKEGQLPSDLFNSMNGAVKSYNGQQVTVTINTDGTRTLTPYPPQTQAESQSDTSQTTDTKPAAAVPGTPVTSPIPVPATGKTTITVKKDDSAPSGVSVTVHDKVLIDYIEEFLQWLSEKVFHRG